MIFSRTLKSRVEPLAEKYFNKKNDLGEVELKNLEDSIVSEVEDYVFSKFLRYRPTYLIEDLKQSARIGIIDAIRRYDPSRGSFCTWVIWEVKNTVGRDKSQQWLKVPSYMIENVSKLNKFIEGYSRKYQLIPTDEEILEELNWSKEKLQRTRHVIALQTTNLDTMNDWEEGRCSKEPISVDQKNTMKIDVSTAISNLDKLQKQVIMMKYYEGRDITEIARKLGLSANKVQNILNKAELELRSLLKDYA